MTDYSAIFPREKCNKKASKVEDSSGQEQRTAMGSELTPQEKIKLITQNLQEVLKPEILEDVIVKQNRPLKIYLGATRNPTHTRVIRMSIADKRISEFSEYFAKMCDKFRDCYHRSTALWLLCPHCKDRPLPPGRMSRQDPARRHPRLSRQSQSTH